MSHRRVYQEEKELAMRPILLLAHATPWMLCVNTHYRIQLGPHALQIGFFPQTLEETNTVHWRMLPPQSTRATTFQHEFSTHFKGIFEVLIVSCFSPGCCLHALDRSILLLHPWLPSFSRELLFSGNPAASSPHSPAHCRHHTYLHNLLLRCL